jgi:hypothetical protein
VHPSRAVQEGHCSHFVKQAGLQLQALLAPSVEKNCPGMMMMEGSPSFKNLLQPGRLHEQAPTQMNF